ncbi:MAG: hypothetical protein JNK64_32230 [Myxococcales bacterium]|nr:hypothetical protein [Myxococcales bacterium]
MTTIDDPTQLVRAIADGGAGPGDLDRLIALGAPALPALVDGLAAGANVPTLTTAMAALGVPAPLATFEPLLAHAAMAVRRAAVAALGATRDAAAVPILAQRLRAMPAAVADALADLAHPDGIAPLRDYVAAAAPTAAPGPAWAAAGVASQVVAAVGAVGALARLGDHTHAALALGAIEVDADEAVRLAGVRALRYVTVPGVAAALARAARDPDAEVATRALEATLLLGRPAEAALWIAMIAADDPNADLARWCLAAWAGAWLPDAATLTDRATAEAWWQQAQPFVVSDRCYRLGALADPGALLDGLAAPPSGFLRAELRARTGCPAVWERLAGDPASPGELAGVRAWWATHGARFTPGELHRWGRVVAPSIVD